MIIFIKWSDKNILITLDSWLRVKYNNPLVIITENGWSDGGQLNDMERIKYLREHLQAVLDAIDDGCNVQAHTTWSMFDNLEWINGFR